MDELRQKVLQGDYDIIAVTESWANEDIGNAELAIDGILMHRKDKAADNRAKGGGVLLYVKEELRSYPTQHLTNEELQDSVWCKIESDGCPVIVGVCYRSTSSSRQNNDNLLNLFVKVTRQSSHSQLFIFGDFNYPEIDYVNYHVLSGPDTDASRFFNRTNDLFLHQHITEWTRHGQQPSLLDFVFTDEDNVIDEIAYLPPLGKVIMPVWT